MTRRHVLRSALLAALAAPLAAACGAERTPADGGQPRSDIARTAGDPAAVPEVVAALQGLAGDLYGRLAGEPGNLVLSPYSVAVALAMTLPGAGGRTATEMRELLGVRDEPRFHRGMNALTAYVEGLAGPQTRADGSDAELVLDAANRLFGQAGVAWERRFLDLLAREYGAELRTVDFAADPERARVQVNDWVADRTRDRIDELVPTGVLDTLTRLVLVNAVYLAAPWEQPFEPALTRPSPFRRADGSRVEVKTMAHPTLATVTARGDGWRSARLPYAGGGLAMTVVLPDPGRTAEVEARLAAGGSAAMVSAARPATLDLRLPRWTTRTQVPLKDVLQRLGMRLAFDSRRADFTPMTEEDLDLHVGAVLHEGFVAVDEAGTEAAAATAVVVRVESAPVTEPFHVDRPFLYLVHDVAHGTPLFVGRVDDPGA